MKKAVLLYLLVLLIISSIGTTVSGKDDSMVYVSNQDREAIYQATQDESYNGYKQLQYDNLTILKDSISQVYTVDLLTFAQTGELVIVPMHLEPRPSNAYEGEGNVYVAKTMCSNTEFGGSIIFYIEDGVAYRKTIFPSGNIERYFPDDINTEANKRYLASCSYADHALRIQNLLGLSEFVPASDVRFVYINYLGCFFYINTTEHEVMVPVGYLSRDNNTLPYQQDIVLTEDELLDKAKAYKAVVDQKKEEYLKWVADHPGEEYNLMGGSSGINEIISACSSVENVLNISDYLNINMTEIQVNKDISGLHSEYDIIKTNNKSITVGIISGVALFTAIIVVFILIKRKKADRLARKSISG